MRQELRVCAVVGSFLVASACAHTKQGYLARGNELFKTGKYQDAVLNYRKAIQTDSLYGEAYYRLGLAALKLGDPSQASAALSRAAQLLPNNTDAKEKLGDLYLAAYLLDSRRPQKMYNQITQLSDDLLARNPNSFEGLRLKGYLATTDRKLKDGIALFRRALQLKPMEPVLTTALVEALFQDGQLKEGEKLAVDLIAQRSSGPIYEVMYRWYYNTNRVPEAENVLKTQVKDHPKQARAFLELARHYARVQKSEEMRSTLQVLLDNPKDFPQSRMVVGDYYLSIHDYPQALRYYEEGSRTNPKDKITYQKRAVDALLAMGRRDDATKLVEEILKQSPKDDEALQVRATLWLDTGLPDQAEAATREFKDLLTRHPEDSSLWFKAGRAGMLTGDLEAARTRFLEALRRRDDLVTARYDLAEISLKEQKPKEAIQFASEILQRRPKDIRARILHAQGLTGTGSFSLARAELSDVLKEFPDNSDARFAWAVLALNEKKYQEAIDTFGKLKSIEDPRVVVTLASAYSALKQPDKAFQTLNDALKKWPDAPPIHESLATVAALNGRYDLAITEFRRVVSYDPKSVEQRLRLGEAYELKGDYQAAIATYKEAQARAPKDGGVAMSLASALAKAGRTNEARAEYGGLIKEHPDDSYALNNLAYLISETGGDLDEAMGFARRAIAATPGQPNFVDTIGFIYLKKGMRDSAIQTFGNLVRKYPRFPTYRYHLGMALLEKGDKTGARKELETALADHPSHGEEEKIRALVTKTQG